MIIEQTSVIGLYLLRIEPRGDARGFFARSFCREEFAEAGLETEFVQQNMSFSQKAGTLRGLHYQLFPARETKVVRCTRGALWDVGVDLRPDSPSFGRWFGTELSQDNRDALYLPEGVAHGFISLSDDCEISYLVSAYYSPEHERGLRWNDPTFAIEWPRRPSIISDRDAGHPNFERTYHLGKGCGE